MIVHKWGAPDAHDVLAALRAGTTTSSQLVETALRAIAEQDRGLKAFAVVLGDSAREAAAAADAARAKGRDLPLLGLPVGVKADLAITGVRHYLSPNAQPAAADCPEVAALRAAGAVVVGHTAMSEGALWATTTSRIHGATGNPHHRALSPGGSSGGSAAAVAAGWVAAAVGTDMGGSVRIPAACCGLVGLKPQRGRRPLDTTDRRWHGLREPGPITRSIRDCALLHSVLGGPPPARAQTGPLGPLRIAVVLGPGDSHGAVPMAMSALLSLGHDVDHEPIAPLGRGLLLAAAPRYLRAAADEVSALGPDSALERRTAQTGRAGRVVPRVAVRASARASVAFEAGVRRRLRDVDVILTPALGAAVPALAQWSSSSAVVAGLGQRRLAEHTAVWNVTGHPALVMPIRSAVPGRPGGPPPAVQLVGRPWSEPTLLALAAALEQATRPAAVQDGGRLPETP